MELIGRTLIAASACFVVVLLAPSAWAVCSYQGEIYAKTTLQQEFSDSKWVVKAKLMSADYHWSDEDESWTLYHLKVLAVYKGNAPVRMDLFTYRNSAGFYLDQGSGPDLSNDYLLFLNPMDPRRTVPEAARKAADINYGCGQSRPWVEVGGEDQKLLKNLSSSH